MPSTALYSSPSTPQQSQLLERAKVFNHLVGTSGMPPAWAFDASGRLVRRDDPGQHVAVGPPVSDPFWKQVVHALPYLAVGIGVPAAAGALMAPSAAAAAATGGGATVGGVAGVGGVGGFTAAGAPIAATATTGIGETVGGYALRYGLPAAGNLVNGVIQSRAASKASDAQQAYLEEALAYEKEKDAYDRKTAEEARALEAQRYGDREGRLAPYRATGASSNAQMASLLGLPAPPNGGIPAPRPFTPTTPLPYAPATSTSSAPASAAPTAPAAPASTGPLVTVRAPTGATRQVPEDQVAYWQSRGATVVEGAA